MRAAVLKMKDPRQIIRDMEKLDEMGEGMEVMLFILKLFRVFSTPLIIVFNRVQPSSAAAFAE